MVCSYFAIDVAIEQLIYQIESDEDVGSEGDESEGEKDGEEEDEDEESGKEQDITNLPAEPEEGILFTFKNLF